MHFCRPCTGSILNALTLCLQRRMSIVNGPSTLVLLPSRCLRPRPHDVTVLLPSHPLLPSPLLLSLLSHVKILTRSTVASVVQSGPSHVEVIPRRSCSLMRPHPCPHRHKANVLSLRVCGIWLTHRPVCATACRASPRSTVNRYCYTYTSTHRCTSDHGHSLHCSPA